MKKIILPVYNIHPQNAFIITEYAHTILSVYVELNVYIIYIYIHFPSTVLLIHFPSKLDKTNYYVHLNVHIIIYTYLLCDGMHRPPRL